jgi:hypothetical protein
MLQISGNIEGIYKVWKIVNLVILTFSEAKNCSK